MIFYLLVILAGIGVTSFAHIASVRRGESENAYKFGMHGQFACAIFSSFMLSLDYMLNPTQRSRQLKSAAASMTSTIWHYRTRTGIFQVVPGERSAPEDALHAFLKAWRERLIAGTDLQNTDMKKEYSKRIYVHHQFQNPRKQVKAVEKLTSRCQNAAGNIAGLQNQITALRPASEPSDNLKVCADVDTGPTHSHDLGRSTPALGRRRHSATRVDMREEVRLQIELKAAREELFKLTWEVEKIDDFQSPLKAEVYVELRIKRERTHYQNRILPCNIWSHFWKLALLALSVSTAVLAHAEQHEPVPIVIAVTMGITSWVAFRALDKKLAKYTATVRALDDQLAWWSSLGEIEKAGKATINQLVLETERIITNESVDWASKPAERTRDETSEKISPQSPLSQAAGATTKGI
jgi:hypothetical protein